jgi:signal transduction histidine kinase
MGSNMFNNNHSVLIVDDEAAIVEILSKFLEEENLKTVSFSDPNKAFEWAKNNSFDILITDLKMTGLTGLELHEKLRIYYPDLLTILMSAYSSLDTAQEAIASSIYAYVNKPFKIEELKGLIQRALEKKDLLDRNRQLVDEQQDLIEKLLVANKKLQKLDQMKSDFVSTVSHELRTPLTSMRNILYNLSKGYIGELNERQVEYLKMMEQDATRLENLINDILDLSQLDSGRYKIKLSEFKALELVESALKVVENNQSSKQIQILTDIDKSLEGALMKADRSKLEQVIVNLLGNSIKYSESGKRIWLRVAEHDGRLVVSVKDEGIGIPKEDQERIFKRFERSEGGTKQGIKGTGLGLAIVKRILDLHQGIIKVQSIPKKGSTFTFELPMIYSNQG